MNELMLLSLYAVSHTTSIKQSQFKIVVFKMSEMCVMLQFTCVRIFCHSRDVLLVYLNKHNIRLSLTGSSLFFFGFFLLMMIAFDGLSVEWCWKESKQELHRLQSERFWKKKPLNSLIFERANLTIAGYTIHCLCCKIA